jgi:arginase
MKYATVLGLPFYTLVKYSGERMAPSKLRKAGLLNALGGSVFDEGDLELPHPERDVVEGGIKNFTYFTDASSRIFESISGLKAERVVLIGGECSLIVGGLAGLREVFRGRPGMLWMDAHGDFNTPETTPSSYIGGMCLALACGRGPHLTAQLDKRSPLIEESNIVHLGSRALDPPEAKAFESSPATLVSMEDVKKRGVKRVSAEVAKLLADRADWIVCHLDVDVVDPDSIIAVNYPTPDGLRPVEASAIIKALNATGKLKALNIAAYNPALDVDGSSATATVELVREAFS